MTAATIIIPVAPYHQALADRAITSAQQQTTPCTVIVAHDPKGRGPSYTRNRALEQVETDFLVFLDADDWIEPTFVERCINMWEPGHYCYTDWYEDEAVKHAPDQPWCNDRQWHVITALLPTNAVKAVGGFDDLPGAEDTELYWALTRKQGLCGIHIQEPLFHYSPDGQRSKKFVFIDGTKALSPAYHETMGEIQRRYANMGGCCGDQHPEVGPPEGQAGDVEAIALWGGNRRVRGPITGRLYPSAGNRKRVMVDPRDARHSPGLWRIVEPEPAMTPQPPRSNGQRPAMRQRPAQTFEELTERLNPMFGVQPAQPAAQQRATVADLRAVEPVATEPDVRRIVGLAEAYYDR